MSDRQAKSRFGMKSNHYFLLLYPIQYVLFAVLISSNVVIKSVGLISLLI
ncbi:MAG: hypothetical protein ACW99A_19205 [Candidatus Kariarchaeaceae archaeon]